MIYHYDTLPPEAFTAQPPIGWDLPVLLPTGYENNAIGLAAAALSIGYYIGLQENKEKEGLNNGKK